MYWASNLATEVLAEAVDLVQRLAESHESRQEAQKWLKTKPLLRADFNQVSERACTAGTIAHETVERWIKAPSSEIRSRILESATGFQIAAREKVQVSIAAAAASSLRAFGEWTKQTRFTLEETETPLVSRRHLFGGCLDCIARLGDSDKVLFDWKTSNDVYAEYACQIAAYKLLWNENFPTDQIESAHLMRFDKTNGNFTHHHFQNLDAATELFLLFRRAYELINQVGKSL